MKIRQLCFLQASLNRDVPLCLLHFFVGNFLKQGKLLLSMVFSLTLKHRQKSRGYKGVQIILSFFSWEIEFLNTTPKVTQIPYASESK